MSGTVDADFSPDIKIAGAQAGIGDTSIDNSSSVTNALEITAETDKDKASIKIAPFTGVYNFSMLFTAPLSKSTKSATFYETDAFANGTSLKINLQKVNFTEEVRIFPLVLEKLHTLCEGAPIAFSFKDSKECDRKDNDLVKNYLASKDPTGGSGVVAIVTNLLSKPMSLYGFTAGIGQKEHKYIDSGSTTEKKETRNPWSIGAYYTYFVPKSFAMTFEYEYQTSYKDNDVETVCPTTPGSDSLLHCATGGIGEPKENINKNVSINVRAPLKIGNTAIAISPKVTYDIEDEVTSFKLPIYLFQNAKKQFTGGISTSWVEGGDGWTYGVFVGSRFNLF